LNNILRTPLYNSLYYDLLNGDEKLQKYLPEFENVKWAEFNKLIANQSSVYSKVKEVILEDNSDITSPKGKTYLDFLTKENTVFIITGQQLGLLASPLYTIYKIITAIKLAENLNSQENGFNYVPLFWLESEDHDFEEINHFGIWNKKFEPQKLTYNGENRNKVSIKHYFFENQIEDFISQLRDELIETEFSAELFVKIKKWFKPDESWLTAIRELLKDIFYESGVLFFKPGNQKIKEISVSFFQSIIENSTELNQQFGKVSNQLKNQGYPNQVTVVEGKIFLFLENENLQREHIYFENNSYHTKESNQKFDKRKLFEFINSNPEKISTSVNSRPLLQSWLLPTAAYVAGPGEIAYWAQTGGMFEQMNIKMPVVYPRISATILEPKIQRYNNKYELNVENIPKKQNDFVNQFLTGNEDDAFTKSKESVKTELETLKQKMIKVDPTLENVYNKTIEKILGQIDFLEHKTIKAKEQKEESLVSHLKQIHAAFFPDGYPQERYLTFVYYLNKFGSDVFNNLYEKLQLGKFEHQIIKI